MPKLFPISLEVEEAALGRILRALNVMPGVARLNLNLQNQQRQLPAPFSEDDEDHREVVQSVPALRDGRSFLTGLAAKKNPLAHNPAYKAIANVLAKTPAHYKILGASLERVGVRSNGVHGYLRRLMVLKCVKKTSPGSYRLTEKGSKVFFNAKLGEQPAAQTEPRQKGLPKNNHSGVRRVILETLAQGQELKTRALKQVIGENGFSPDNVYGLGLKMRSEGLIEFSDGVFSITKQGQEVYENRPASSNPPQQEEGLDANG